MEIWTSNLIIFLILFELNFFEVKIRTTLCEWESSQHRVTFHQIRKDCSAMVFPFHRHVKKIYPFMNLHVVATRWNNFQHNGALPSLFLCVILRMRQSPSVSSLFRSPHLWVNDFLSNYTSVMIMMMREQFKNYRRNRPIY